MENKVAILSHEIERLNEILHKYSKEIVPSLEEKNRAISLECEEYRRRLTEFVEINKQSQEVAARLRIVTQESEQSARRVQEY